MHIDPLRRGPFVLCALASAALSLGAGTVQAQAPSADTPWHVVVSQSFTQDSNFLRLAEGDAAPVASSRDERIAVSGLRAGLDLRPGRQRFVGGLELRDHRHARNERFDHLAHEARLAWQWQTAGRWSGSVEGLTRQTLSPINESGVGLLASKNLRRRDALAASVQLGGESVLALNARLGHRRLDNSLDLPALRSRDLRADEASVGARWQPGAALRVDAALRLEDGTYPRAATLAGGGFVAERYSARHVDLAARYEPSGQSVFDLRLAHGRSRHRLEPVRDFSGPSGSVAWDWWPSGLVRSRLRLARERLQDSYAVDAAAAAGDSRLRDSATWQIDYEPSAKLRWQFSLASHEDRRQRVQTGAAPLTGRETTRLVRLGAIWQPLMRLEARCDLTHERRSGRGDLGSSLNGEQVGCAVSWRFD
jgi:hypothetical protein